MPAKTRTDRGEHPGIALVTAVAVAAVPAVLWTGLKDYTLAPKLLVLQVCLVAALALWCVRGRPALALPAPGLPALAYLAVAGVSVFWALDRTAGLLELTKLLSGVLLFIVVARNVGPRGRVILQKTWVVSALLLSLLGIAEHLGHPVLVLPSAGLPSATFGFRNIAAMYLVLSLPFAAALFLQSTSRAWVWLSAAAVAAMLIFLLYTRTRGAWAGLAGGVLLTAAAVLLAARSGARTPVPAGPRLMPAVLAVALVLGLGFLPSGLPKVGPQSLDEKKADVLTAAASTFSTGGDRGRTAVWRHTLGMVADHPVGGVGLGNWSVYYPAYDRGDRVTFKAAPERPHNDVLGVLAETGIAGLACCVWLAVAAWVLAWRGLKSGRPDTFWLTCACLCSLAAITGHSLFSFPRERITPVAFSWLALGLLAASDPQPAALAARRVRRVGLAALLAVSLLQLSFTVALIRFEGHLHRAAVAERRNDMPAVARESTAALGIGMFHPEAATVAGYALNQVGDYEAAYRMYVQATRRRPYDIQLLNGMAIACQNLGRTEEAIGYYERALATVPDLPDVLFNLAGLLSSSGRLAEAETAYGRVVVLRPDDAQAHFALGLLYEKTGRTADAVAAYRAFLKYWTGEPRYRASVKARIDRLEHPTE